MRKSILRGVTVGTAAAVLTAVGVSYAAWSVNGATTAPTGGNSKGAKSVPLEVTTDPVVAVAYPTLSVTQTVTVLNRNAFAVQLNSLTTSISSEDAACHQGLNPQPTYNYWSGYYYPPAAYTATFDAAALTRLTKDSSARIPVQITFTNDFPQTCEDKPLSITFSTTGSSAA